MIHLIFPFALASILAGAGVYGILARRNAILMLIGVELVLAAAGLILVTMSTWLPDGDAAGQIMTIFVITLAAAEVCLALGIVLAAFRLQGHIDLGESLDDDLEGGDLRNNPGGSTLAGNKRDDSSDDNVEVGV